MSKCFVPTLTIRILLPLFLLLNLSSCDDNSPVPSPEKELLIYCGITMVKPISDLARKFEQQHPVKIIISQGGSESLYNSLKSSKKGDLYIPGSFAFREHHLEEGLLGEYRDLGLNQAALLVHKGNPKHISADLDNLYNENLAVVIASPEMGSIGHETKMILQRKGIYEKVLDNVVYQTTDSRALNYALKKGDADLVLNWKTTAFFKQNRPFIDAIDLNPQDAPPRRIAINLLTFSREAELAKSFMNFASSKEGLQVFSKYGFSLPSAQKD